MASGGWNRLRRRKPAGDLPEPDSDNVDLSGEEHAWWADRDGLDAGVPHGKRRREPEPEPEPEHSVFEDYFTRESLFEQHASDEPLLPEDDPYRVLGVPETCSWAEITYAHRQLAKRHHPDRLVEPTPEERSRSEARIRELNIAYTELRRRRGR